MSRTNKQSVHQGAAVFVAKAFRKNLFCIKLAIILVVAGLMPAGCNRHESKTLIPLHIGYQKWGTCSILKARGDLEKRLLPVGYSVQWIEFPAGPPLLEAMNAGSVDFGHTGDSPPVFAQAAGVPLIYVGSSSPCPESSGIVVRTDSTIRTLSDLRGKKVAFTKGSSAHTMVLRALPSAGVTLEEIEPVYLSPADGRAALQAGSVDAWSIWDPFLALAEHEGSVRVIASGKGFVYGREFYLASSPFLEKHRSTIAIVLAELNDVKRWATENPSAVSGLLASQIGIDAKALERAEKRLGRYGVETNETTVTAEQQQLADDYHLLKLIPQKIDVRPAFDFVAPLTGH